MKKNIHQVHGPDSWLLCWLLCSGCPKQMESYPEETVKNSPNRENVPGAGGGRMENSVLSVRLVQLA